MVLRVRPLEVEADLPFAGLSDLVRPLQRHVAGLPERQRAALSGALALGPPAPDDRFAVAAATLNLLATAAQDAPVLAVIDDAHWLDAPSREALLFAARRIAGEGVVLLFATRDHEWLSGVGIETLELQGLRPDDTEALLAGTGLAVDEDVRRQLVAGTRGNPLALLEATGNLSAAQLGGTVALAAPLAVGAALEQAFARDLDGLPADTRRALLIAAASRTGVTGEILNALAAVGLDRSALEPAERMGLVTVTDRVGFRHPLIRSAAYHRQDRVEQRAAHRAFASTLGAGERSAWHLAEASLGPDEQAAAELEAFGSTALARSAYAAAGSAFETAAGLSPDDADRLRRTLVAGRALWLGGESQRAADLLHARPRPCHRADGPSRPAATSLGDGDVHPPGVGDAGDARRRGRTRPAPRPRTRGRDVRHREPGVHPARRPGTGRGMRPPRRRRGRARQCGRDLRGSGDAGHRRGQRGRCRTGPRAAHRPGRAGAGGSADR